MAPFLFPASMFFLPLLLQHSLGLRGDAINVLYVNTHLSLILRTLCSHELILHCSLEKDPSLVKAENSICLCVSAELDNMSVCLYNSIRGVSLNPEFGYSFNRFVFLKMELI